MWSYSNKKMRTKRYSINPLRDDILCRLVSLLRSPPGAGTNEIWLFSCYLSSRGVDPQTGCPAPHCPVRPPARGVDWRSVCPAGRRVTLGRGPWETVSVTSPSWTGSRTRHPWSDVCQSLQATNNCYFDVSLGCWESCNQCTCTQYHTHSQNNSTHNM